jgi:4-hydroxy-tetrahydrodipicolinate synthase
MTMKDTSFRGVVPALTTPFRADLSLDADGFATLADQVIKDGVDALLVNGCTGESWSLTTDERATIFRAAAEVSKGRVRVVAGCSAITAQETIAKIRQAEKAGCDYAMVSPPWYVIPGPEEIMEHYREVLDATEIPVVLYNIPRRTGVQITPDMVDRLADHPKVIAIKESSKDWGILSQVIRRTRDRISVFAGYASFFGLAALTEGAVGYMDSGTPVFGPKSPAFYRAAISGDLTTARQIQIEMASMLDSFFGLGTFPSSVKASLDLIGRPGGPTRPPIRPLNASQKETLRQHIIAAGFIVGEQAAAE